MEPSMIPMDLLRMLHAVALLGDPEAGPYFGIYKLSIFGMETPCP
jgi:hypothetical protein